MSRHYIGGLKLKDMYAIKHALQAAVEEKKETYKTFDTNRYSYPYPQKIEERITKDIQHEENLIKKFEKEIESFESRIRRVKSDKST